MSVFSAVDYYMWKPLCLLSWYRNPSSSLPRRVFSEFWSANFTQALQTAQNTPFFDRKGVWSAKNGHDFKNFARAKRAFFIIETPYVKTWICHCSANCLVFHFTSNGWNTGVTAWNGHLVFFLRRSHRILTAFIVVSLHGDQIQNVRFASWSTNLQ